MQLDEYQDMMKELRTVNKNLTILINRVDKVPTKKEIEDAIQNATPSLPGAVK